MQLPLTRSSSYSGRNTKFFALPNVPLALKMRKKVIAEPGTERLRRRISMKKLSPDNEEN